MRHGQVIPIRSNVLFEVTLVGCDYYNVLYILIRGRFSQSLESFCTINIVHNQK